MIVAVYWGILQLPYYFRSRAGWWQNIMSVPVNVLTHIEGGLSVLYVKIMDICWHPTEWNMDRLGLRVPVRGACVHLRFSVWLLHER